MPLRTSSQAIRHAVSQPGIQGSMQQTQVSAALIAAWHREQCTMQHALLSSSAVPSEHESQSTRPDTMVSICHYCRTAGSSRRALSRKLRWWPSLHSTPSFFGHVLELSTRTPGWKPVSMSGSSWPACGAAGTGTGQARGVPRLGHTSASCSVRARLQQHTHRSVRSMSGLSWPACRAAGTGTGQVMGCLRLGHTSASDSVRARLQSRAGVSQAQLVS